MRILPANDLESVIYLKRQETNLKIFRQLLTIRKKALRSNLLDSKSLILIKGDNLPSSIPLLKPFIKMYYTITPLNFLALKSYPIFKHSNSLPEFRSSRSIKQILLYRKHPLIGRNFQSNKSPKRNRHY